MSNLIDENPCRRFPFPSTLLMVMKDWGVYPLGISDFTVGCRIFDQSSDRRENFITAYTHAIIKEILRKEKETEATK